MAEDLKKEKDEEIRQRLFHWADHVIDVLVKNILESSWKEQLAEALMNGHTAIAISLRDIRHKVMIPGSCLPHSHNIFSSVTTVYQTPTEFRKYGGGPTLWTSLFQAMDLQWSGLRFVKTDHDLIVQYA